MIPRPTRTLLRKQTPNIIRRWSRCDMHRWTAIVIVLAVNWLVWPVLHWRLVVVLESGTGFKPRPLTVFYIGHCVHLTAIRRWVRLHRPSTTPLKAVWIATRHHHDRHRQHHQWNELLHLNLLCLTVLNPIGLSCLNTQDILYYVLYTQTYFLSSCHPKKLFRILLLQF